MPLDVTEIKKTIKKQKTEYSGDTSIRCPECHFFFSKIANFV